MIHAHFTWSAGYVGARLKEKYGKPLVTTAHGFDIYDLPFIDEEWKDKIEYVLNTSDFIITVSNSNLKCINQLQAIPPVQVIPNGYRADLFSPQDMMVCRKTLGLPIDKKIILTVGNLVEIKGHKYLIDAMSQIVQSHENVLCLIIGGGTLKNKLEKQIRELHLENNVKLIGRKPHNEITTWMNACDLFVLPSLNEGNPTVLVEAFGTGTPYVGTNVGGIPEIVNSEKLGLLCDPGNSKALAQVVVQAIKKEWNKSIINRYARQYTWENITNKIIKIHNRLIE